MINRFLEPILIEKIGKKKAIILIGPRQVGKTTLIEKILKNKNYLHLTGDNPNDTVALNNIGLEQLRIILSNQAYVFIDEAQRFKNIGLTLKLITDHIKETQVFVSGSSAFEIQNLMNEPLTGRKFEYHLFPISWNEYVGNKGLLNALKTIENRLLFGMYPDVINNEGDEEETLRALSDSYLYKDILSLNKIRKPEVLNDLLRALAFQIGSEVNLNELSQLIGISKDTISNYIQILEQAFIIFRLSSFSKNLRNEIKFNNKIFFWDLGIRNAIIGNFNPVPNRQDIGQLWENFIICERLKKLRYEKSFAQSYFWRTSQQQEIDYIEVQDDKINAYEIKWNPKAKAKFPKTFTNNYESECLIVNRENFNEFLN